MAVQARSAWRQRQIDEANDPDAPAKRLAELDEERKVIINEVQSAKTSLDDKLGASVPLPPILAPTPTKGGTAGTPSTPPAPFDLSQKPVLDAVDKELLRRRGHKIKGGKGKSKRADDQLSDKKMKELMGQSGIIFDDLPLNKDGHARRLLAATGEKIRFMVRPNGGAWIVYDEATGAWTTEAAPQRVGEHVVKLAYVMLDWANQAGAKAAEAGLTADEKQELEMLERRLQREHRSILSNIPSITKHASYIRSRTSRDGVRRRPVPHRRAERRARPADVQADGACSQQLRAAPAPRHLRPQGEGADVPQGVHRGAAQRCGA